MNLLQQGPQQQQHQHQHSCIRASLGVCSRRVSSQCFAATGDKPPPIRRTRQRVERKQLQKQAQREYLRGIYEQASKVDEEHIYITLQDTSPALQAQAAATSQTAALNQQLQQHIQAATNPRQLLQLLQGSAEGVNYLTLVDACERAVQLCTLDTIITTTSSSSINSGSSNSSSSPAAQGSGPAGGLPTPGQGVNAQQQQQQQQGQQQLVELLGRLALQHAAAFQAAHFAQVAQCLSRLGCSETTFWQQFAHTCERKLGAFTLSHLVTLLGAFVTVNFTPSLNWLERGYYQAKKHLRSGTLGDLSHLVWAWSELGYTPRDQTLVNDIKSLARVRLRQQQYTGQQLVALLHGMARLPRYCPNGEWLSAFAAALEPHLPSCAPGDALDALVSLTVMGHRVTPTWLATCLGTLTPSLQASAAATATAAGAAVAGTGAAVGAGQGRDAGSAAAEEAAGQAVVAMGIPGFTGEQLAVLGWCLAEAAAPPPPDWMDAYAAAVYSHLPGMAADGVVDVLWGFGALQYIPGEPLVQALLGQVQGYLQQLKPEGLQRLSLALVKLLPAQLLEGLTGDGTAVQGVVGAGADAVMPSASPSATPTDTAPPAAAKQAATPPAAAIEAAAAASSNLSLGFEEVDGVGVTPSPAFLHALQQRSRQVMLGSSAAQLADVLLLFAITSRQQPAEPVASGQQAQQQQQQQQQQAQEEKKKGRRGKQTPASASTAAAGQLSGGFRPSEEYLEAAVQQAAATAADCAPAAAAQVLWALAALQYKPQPQLLHGLLGALQGKLHLLNTLEFAGVVWALSCLRHRPGVPWLGQYLTEAAAKIRYLGEQDLTDMLWALACFGAEPGGAWLQQVLQLVGSRAGSMTVKQLAVVVWALQQLGMEAEAGDAGVLTLLAQRLVAPAGAATAAQR